MSEWQPIETAPKDKTMVALLYVDGRHKRYGVGWWMPTDGWQCWYDVGFNKPPTYWLPLPQPPMTLKLPQDFSEQTKAALKAIDDAQRAAAVFLASNPLCD